MPKISAEKLQPVKVAAGMEASVEAWGDLIEKIFESVEDPSNAMDIIVSQVHKGIASTLHAETSATDPDCAVVGVLLALRELDCVADNLLQACLRLDSQNAAMKSFVEFLKKDEDDKDSDDDDA